MLVGTLSQTKEFDDFRDGIIFSISWVVVQVHLILGNEFWYACFKE